LRKDVLVDWHNARRATFHRASFGRDPNCVNPVLFDNVLPA